MNTNTEAARIAGLVMAVIIAVAGLLGWALTPEEYNHIAVLVTVGVGVFASLGGMEWVRKKVASRRTVEYKAGRDVARQVFRK